jgi:hypothetical protein
MAERRILTMLAINAHSVSCGECMYLDPVASRCVLFTGRLESGMRGPHRAEECLDAEKRYQATFDAIDKMQG